MPLIATVKMSPSVCTDRTLNRNSVCERAKATLEGAEPVNSSLKS